jgi:hypothetical protein
VTRTAPRRAPTRRRAVAGFDQDAYEAEVEAFSGAEGEAYYANFAGLSPELDLATVYERHSGLFSEAAIDGLRTAAAGSDAASRRASRLLGFAVNGHLARTVAPITDRIAGAESTAIVVWRRERIRYRQASIRVADISDRDERNALDERYRMAMEAMNGMREERWTILHAAARALGAGDYAALIRESSGIDFDAVAASASDFLRDSETLYFAALRRYLALIEIEGGDGTVADLGHLLRGRGWDQYFDLGRLMRVLRASLAGLGIDLDTQRGITLDLEPRPGKSPRAFCVPIKVPGDVRFVVQPRGGHDDYDGALHEMGHLQHFAHIGSRLAPADRYVGDESVTEGWAFLFQYLMVEPEWLASELRMPRDAIAGWLDFAAFRRLFYLRRYAAKLLYELRLHRGGAWTIHRAEYSGLLGLLTGVRTPDTKYLADVDDALYAGRYLRAWLFEASASTAMRERFGPTWWRTPEAGTFLKGTWRTGLGPSAEDIVASLGYDQLDWRPVLRQIRAQLIGEMSGYGGPNLTTRAGSRKV